jgi:hypothetical protein
VDEKIAVKEVPKDLKKLATKVLETEQAVEGKVVPKVRGAAQDLKREAKAAAGSVAEDLDRAAGSVGKDVDRAVGSAAQDLDKAAEQAAAKVEANVDAAKDTVDLVMPHASDAASRSRCKMHNDVRTIRRGGLNTYVKCGV